MNDRDSIRDEITDLFYDLDNFVWIRTAGGELCGPYDSEQEAREEQMEFTITLVVAVNADDQAQANEEAIQLAERISAEVRDVCRESN